MIPAELRDPVTGARKLTWHAVFEAYDPELFKVFREWQKAALRTKELDPKTRELMVVAINSVVKWPSPFFDSHVHGTLDRGGRLVEVLEAIGIAERYGGAAAFKHGLERTAHAIRQRLAEGAPAPEQTEEPWEEVARGQRALDAKARELIAVAIDSLLAWPAASTSADIHAAFDRGATIQEVLEAVAAAAQFGGGHAFNHGLTIMGEAIAERTAAGTPPSHHRDGGTQQ